MCVAERIVASFAPLDNLQAKQPVCSKHKARQVSKAAHVFTLFWFGVPSLATMFGHSSCPDGSTSFGQRTLLRPAPGSDGKASGEAPGPKHRSLGVQIETQVEEEKIANYHSLGAGICQFDPFYLVLGAFEYQVLIATHLQGFKVQFKTGSLVTIVGLDRNNCKRCALPASAPPSAQRLWFDCKQQSWSSGDSGMDRFWRRWTNSCHEPAGIPEARARRCTGPGASHGALLGWLLVGLGLSRLLDTGLGPRPVSDM